MKIAVIIPAAGIGKRFTASSSPSARSQLKTEIDLEGRPVVIRSIELFLNRDDVEQVIVAVDPDRLASFQLRWGDKLAFHGVKLVAGGKAERWETVLKSIEAVQDSCTHVAIHDAVRPLTGHQLVDRVFEAGKQYSAVIPAIPISGTIKRVAHCERKADAAEDPMDAILGSTGKPSFEVKRVVETVSRVGLVEVQTPQLFELTLLRQAYAQITQGTVDPKRVTDDAGLVEALGEPVHIVDGEATNLKITRAEDTELAKAILASRHGKEATKLAKKRLFDIDEDV